jgi:hypothetical protein
LITAFVSERAKIPCDSDIKTYDAANRAVPLNRARKNNEHVNPSDGQILFTGRQPYESAIERDQDTHNPSVRFANPAPSQSQYLLIEPSH